MGLFDPVTSNQTSVSTSGLPAWVNEGARENFELARALTSRPYPTYSGSRVAGQSADTTKAFDAIRKSVGSTKPYFDGARSLLGEASGGVGGMDLSAYMDPFSDQVIDSVTRRIGEAGDIQRRQIRQKAQMGGNFNSMRHGVVEAQSLEDQNDLLADTIAGLMSANFKRAQDVAGQDLSRMATIAPIMADLGTREQTAGLKDAAALEAIGASQEGRTQKSLDLAYEDFLKQWGFPLDMIDYRMRALSGSPQERTTTTTAPVNMANPFATALGAGVSLASLFS